MKANREELKQIRDAIDDLEAHPPETPMERLKAALLLAQARDYLEDDADRAENERRRSTLPDEGRYRVAHEDGVWLTYFDDQPFSANRSKGSAYWDAWDHTENPDHYVMPPKRGRKKP